MIGFRARLRVGRPRVSTRPRSPRRTGSGGRRSSGGRTTSRSPDVSSTRGSTRRTAWLRSTSSDRRPQPPDRRRHDHLSGAARTDDRRPPESRGLASRGTRPGYEFQIGQIEMVSNTGTYLDTPFHRFADGHDLAGLDLRRVVDVRRRAHRRDRGPRGRRGPARRCRRRGSGGAVPHRLGRRTGAPRATATAAIRSSASTRPSALVDARRRGRRHRLGEHRRHRRRRAPDPHDPARRRHPDRRALCRLDELAGRTFRSPPPHRRSAAWERSPSAPTPSRPDRFPKHRIQM